MRLVIFLISLFFLGCGSWYVWDNVAFFRQLGQKSFLVSEFPTLEISYSAEELMHAHKNELLKNTNYTFLEPKLVFYPYLLMDVKYSKERGSTGEGILLW